MCVARGIVDERRVPSRLMYRRGQTRVVTDEPHYMHAVILSLLWGFPDDFGIEVGGVTVVL